MKILVCIKPVFEDEAINPGDAGNPGDVQIHGTAEDPPRYKMNRFDEFALEEALLIKSQLSDVSIHAVSVGPPAASGVIRRALGMGADHGIHVVTDNHLFPGPFETAGWITRTVRDSEYSLILAGVVSEDRMQGLVGPLVAENLKRPYATAVLFQRISGDQQSVYAEREIERGAREMIEMDLPAVLTVQSGINTPRYPSLSNMLRGKQQPLEIVSMNQMDQMDQLAQVSARQRHIGFFPPEARRKLKILEGNRNEKAKALLGILQNMGFMR
jgi:electron transfer flavoprotein beta subunit